MSLVTTPHFVSALSSRCSQLILCADHPHGSLRTGQAKRLKDPENENDHLKPLQVDAELDKAILREAASACRRRAQLNF